MLEVPSVISGSGIPSQPTGACVEGVLVFHAGYDLVKLCALSLHVCLGSESEHGFTIQLQEPASSD